MDYFRKALEKKYEQKHFQQLRCALSLERHDGLIHFNTLDFLGLASHPYVRKNTIDFVLRFGAGSSTSRILPDHLRAHALLEKKLSNLISFERSLLFPNAFAAEEALFTALSLSGATFYIENSYPVQKIKSHLSKKSTLHFFDRHTLDPLPDGREPKIILASSVCPKTGELIDMRSLMTHASQSNATLIVDDSHAVGILGQWGMGLSAGRKGIDVVIGSFGKVTGTFGAYIGCNQLIADYLTAHQNIPVLPPASLGAINAALDLIPDMDAERSKVLTMAQGLRRKLKLDGHNIIETNSHIVGIHTNGGMYLANTLADHGIIAVANGSIAFNLSVKHTQGELQLLAARLPGLAHARS